MMDACKDVFTSRQDARFLAVAVGGLEAGEVRALLPALLQLPPEQWPAIKHRLLRPRTHLEGAALVLVYLLCIYLFVSCM